MLSVKIQSTTVAHNKIVFACISRWIFDFTQRADDVVLNSLKNSHPTSQNLFFLVLLSSVNERVSQRWIN